MRFSGSLCGSFFPKTNSDNSRAVSFCFESFLPTRNVGLPGAFSPAGIAAHRKIAIAAEPDLHTGATLFPCGATGTLTMALCPQAQIVLTLAMEIGQFHQTARHQKNRSENPSPARSRAPANRIHPPSRPADPSVPEQKLRFVCNDDIRAAGFIKGITGISIGQDDLHPAVQTDAREDRPPPFRSSIKSLISPKPSSPTSHHRTA